ncbi:MAG: hypothetical protein ABIE07_02410 [Candidatus Zixiibacteriota bacterium]
MEGLLNYLIIACGFILPAGVFALIGYIIYRRLRGKSTHTAGTSFVGENIFMNMGQENQKSAMEEVQYIREDKRDDADSGDPPKPGEGKRF